MNCQKKSLSNKGLSLVEIMVVAGILGFLGLAVSTTFTDIFKMQTKIIGGDEANDFASSLGRFIFSESSCTAALKDKVFPVGLNIKNPKTDITLPSYLGYGGGSAGASVTLKAGNEITNKLRILTLKMIDKKMAVERTSYEGKPADRYLAQVILTTESKVGSNWNENVPRNYEFPILVEPASKKVIRCMSSSSLQDACVAMGSELDPATGKCVPKSQCFYEGFYTVHECNGRVSCTPEPAWCPDENVRCPPGGKCKDGKFCTEPVICPNNANSCPPNTPNPITGTISCPKGGATKTQTGESSWTITVRCGKKCNQTINVEAKYFICLKCQ